MTDRIARIMWQLFEPIHAVTYFAPEARAASDGAGLRGFWMGYFAQRAAPLGPVGPEIVTACCYGFAPRRVARAIPDAWQYTTPEQALRARLDGADAALRGLLGEAIGSESMKTAADIAWDAATHASTAGRVLAAANQALPKHSQPHLQLWQAATTLREHRGDGHVAVLAGERHFAGGVPSHQGRRGRDRHRGPAHGTPVERRRVARRQNRPPRTGLAQCGVRADHRGPTGARPRRRADRPSRRSAVASTRPRPDQGAGRAAAPLDEGDR